MLIGKRHRPPMKRTSSLKEIVFDVGGGEDGDRDRDRDGDRDPHNPFTSYHGHNNYVLDGVDHRVSVSPRNNRRHSADFLLQVCSLCNRGLIPGRDIYMYKGDKGFCSIECRQEQMKEDEEEGNKGKCSMGKKETVSLV